MAIRLKRVAAHNGHTRTLHGCPFHRILTRKSVAWRLSEGILANRFVTPRVIKPMPPVPKSFDQGGG